MICCIPGCSKPAWIFGRCGKHGHELKQNDPAEVARIQAMTQAERESAFYRTKNPLPLSWEFEPSESQTEELIKICGSGQHHVKIGLSLPEPAHQASKNSEEENQDHVTGRDKPNEGR